MTTLDVALFRTLDDLACGVGFASEEAVSRSRRFHAALESAEPLSLTIAASLLERRGGRVALYTGFVVPGKYPRGENDGPLGTVALARALKALGFSPIVFVDPEILETTRWLLAEFGAGIGVQPIPEGPPSPVDVAIAVEKPGANAQGFMHTFDGARIEGGSRSVDSHFAALAQRRTLTVGIGDQGNEIGFGLLGDALPQIHPPIDRCTCGCGGTIAAATATEYLYPVAVSNWGAYALVAALALLTRDTSILLQPEEEKRMLKVCAVRGCCDGARRRGMYGIDGIDGHVSVRLVAAMRNLVLGELGDDMSAPVHDPIESGNEALRG